MRLVAQALQEEQHGVAGRKLPRAAVGQVEGLAAGVAVGALGDRDQRHVVDAEIGEHRARGRKLARAAVDEHEVGPGAAFALGVFLDRALEAPRQHLAHHAEIVACRDGAFGRRRAGLALGPRRLRRRGLDVELAIGRFHEAFRPGHHHRAHRVGALDVAVVVDLDALGRRLEAKRVGHALQHLALRRAFGEPARERGPGIFERVLDELALVAALRRGQLHLAAGAHRQRFLHQRGVGHLLAQQHQLRRRLVVVELADESSQHFLAGRGLVVAREIGAVAPVLAAAEEEHLDAGLSGLARGRDHVGLVDVLHVDVLPRLDVGEGPDAVAIGGGGLELQRRARRLHRGGEALADAGVAAREEILGLADVRRVVLGRHAADARRAAALDLVQQAGAGARGERAVGARAQQERALQRIERAVHRAGRGERAVIDSAFVARAAVLDDARPALRALERRARSGGGDVDVGERLVVAQQHVVARLQALDEVRFEQQRLDLGVGRDDLERRRFRHHAAQALGQLGDRGVVRDALGEAARLADVERVAASVEHAIDAGPLRQARQLLLDQRGAGRQRSLRDARALRAARAARAVFALVVRLAHAANFGAPAAASTPASRTAPRGPPKAPVNNSVENNASRTKGLSAQAACVILPRRRAPQAKRLIWHDNVRTARSRIRHKAGKIKMLTRIGRAFSPVHKHGRRRPLAPIPVGAAEISAEFPLAH